MIYWIIGTSGSGKTYYSRVLANKWKVDRIYHLDDIVRFLKYDEDKGKKNELFNSCERFLYGIKDGMIIEGMPNDDIVKIVKQLLKGFKIKYIHINIDYKTYLKQIKGTGRPKKTKEEYYKSCKMAEMFDETIEIRSEKEFKEFIKKYENTNNK